MADRLTEYRGKRHTGRTPEPAGDAPAGRRAKKVAAAPRFVIQEHHATRLHWDLRLEHEGVLVSFAIPNALPLAPKDNRLAVHTEDHPVEYLDFHGDIPKGEYGGGSMTIWDTGTYDVLKWEPRKIEVALHGERIDARYALFPLDGPEGKDWMIHRMDPPADPADAESLPEHVEPMLAKPGGLPPDREADRWALEVKWDGVRLIISSEPGRLTLHTRNLNEVTKRYPELAPLNRALSHHRAILDGEVVAFGPDGRPSFGALQRRMHVDREGQIRRLAKEVPVTLVVFDVLWLDGHWLTAESYEDRRAALRRLLGDGERWIVPEPLDGPPEQVLAAVRAQGLEGVVAKRRDSPYEMGRRSSCWVKVKALNRDDFLVAGWVPGEGRRRNRIGALLLGEQDGQGALRHVGRVGTGFTEKELDRLARILAPLERPTSPFDGGGPKVPREAVFVEPVLAAEIEFLERSRDGVLRAPSYKGLRDDKNPTAAGRPAGGRSSGSARPAAPATTAGAPAGRPATAARSTKGTATILDVDGHDVRLSNPDKVLYPATGFTKADLVDYHLAIAEVLLPHIADRQLTLKRYPNGVDGEYFYEKNAPSHRPEWVTTSGGFVVADSRATLVWLANLADLELHTPMARIEDTRRPTILAFDLDPGPPAGLAECCTVARWLKAMLDGLGLASFPKTSGSKGLQVYVPLNHPETTYDDTKGFAKMVAELLEAEAPELVVSRQRKDIRGGRVLVDWSQNDEHKTTVTVYSPRAKEEPTVSTPLDWSEVLDGDPARLRFTTDDVLARVARSGDLFAPVLSLVQRLPR